MSTNTIANDKTKTESSGNDVQHLLVSSSLAASIFYEEGNEGSYQLLKAILTSQVFVHEAKNWFKKTRPNGKCCHSFPSGHASISFTSAAFIHKRYGWEYGIPAYIASSYVGYSRVYADKHFERDIFASAAIGIISGFYFTDKYEDIDIIPVISDEQVGVYFSISFD